jgi:hypothetical protein
MSAKVFISYRRGDSRYQARMIHAAFCRAIPRQDVFMDVDSIPPGANFRKILKEWVDQCDVLLALIGPGWIDATDFNTGRRRLDDASDFVRIEIGEGLARGIPVVPVLLDGTSMPSSDSLPLDLRELVDRQAELVEYRTFDVDVDRLIHKLNLHCSAAPVPEDGILSTTPPAPQRAIAPEKLQTPDFSTESVVFAVGAWKIMHRGPGILGQTYIWSSNGNKAIQIDGSYWSLHQKVKGLFGTQKIEEFTVHEVDHLARRAFYERPWLPHLHNEGIPIRSAKRTLLDRFSPGKSATLTIDNEGIHIVFSDNAQIKLDHQGVYIYYTDRFGKNKTFQ